MTHAELLTALAAAGLRTPCQQINDLRPGLLKQVLRRDDDGTVQRRRRGRRRKARGSSTRDSARYSSTTAAIIRTEAASVVRALISKSSTKERMSMSQEPNTEAPSSTIMHVVCNTAGFGSCTVRTPASSSCSS